MLLVPEDMSIWKFNASLPQHMAAVKAVQAAKLRRTEDVACLSQGPVVVQACKRCDVLRGDGRRILR